jgi:hypothetical protein
MNSNRLPNLRIQPTALRAAADIQTVGRHKEEHMSNSVSRVKRLWLWLIEARYAWLALGVIAFALIVSLRPQTPEPVIRLTGLVLQLLGIGTVIWGISKTRALFGHPSFSVKVKSWFERFPLRRKSPVQATVAAILSDATLNARGYVMQGPGPNSTVETRLNALEENISSIHERISSIERVMDEEFRKKDVGTHLTRHLNGLTDADTVRSHNYFWYDPNPEDWPSDTWDDYYSVSTGYFKASSLPNDPSWKWGSPWRLPYDWSFSDGQTFSIGGQAFLVSGPHSGYTAFGKAVQYWKLVNRDKFLYWDGGGDWKQYVHAGDITLWYDAGNTRLELHSNVLRRSYYKGNLTSHTVQYIRNLTSSNSFPSAHGLVQDATYPQIPDSPLDHQGKSSHQYDYDRFLRDTIFQADIVNESNDSQ